MKLKWKISASRSVWHAESIHAFGKYRIGQDTTYSIYYVSYRYIDGEGNTREIEVGKEWTLKGAKALADERERGHVA